MFLIPGEKESGKSHGMRQKRKVESIRKSIGKTQPIWYILLSPILRNDDIDHSARHNDYFTNRLAVQPFLYAR